MVKAWWCNSNGVDKSGIITWMVLLYISWYLKWISYYECLLYGQTLISDLCHLKLKINQKGQPKRYCVSSGLRLHSDFGSLVIIHLRHIVQITKELKKLGSEPSVLWEGTPETTLQMTTRRRFLPNLISTDGHFYCDILLL